MKIALASKKFINNDISHNVSVIINTLDKLSNSVDFVCFGECFLQGFDCLTWNFSNDKNIAVHAKSQFISKIRKKAMLRQIAVAFGYIEKDFNVIFSSYMVISKEGQILANFRRLSKGWKEHVADFHYQEGFEYPTFQIENVTFSVGLCGDLWDDKIVDCISKLNTNVTLWPVYIDYSEVKWNCNEKFEYCKQALLFNEKVLLVNSLCDGANKAKGASAYFSNGAIRDEIFAGYEDILIVEI